MCPTLYYALKDGLLLSERGLYPRRDKNSSYIFILKVLCTTEPVYRIKGMKCAIYLEVKSCYSTDNSTIMLLVVD
jgi:hypothetical protein